MATSDTILRCPRCRTPHDGHQAAGGVLECVVCDHHWQPSRAGITGGHLLNTPATGAAPRLVLPSAPVKPPSRPPTEEYLPGDPQTEAARNGPLTERKDARRSGRQVVVRPIAEIQPVVDPQTSDLFERLELEARNSRIIPEGESSTGLAAQPGTALAADPRQVSCPVCGVRFERQAGDRHNCPQCTTSFDEGSGRLEVGAGAGDRLIGATIHGCLIDRKLGEGGMGTVYHARQLSLDRSVAVKILPPDLARNKNFIQRFEREAKSLARINHPNILHIYDFGEDPQIGLYFMLIEFVEGLDLGEMLNRKGQISPLEMLDLLRQALTGLEAAAEKGVIHRDIKPDNLMIADNGTVKVSDFGLAKGMVAQIGVTAAGVRVGTPAFMSPEQCDGADVDYRSDVYNLGATAYLCMTGRLPFDGETPFSIMLKHKTERPPPMRSVDPTIDEEVDTLILRMLAKRPEQRCANLSELIHEVERLEVKLSGTDSILRKSRGPFRAVRSQMPRVPIDVSAASIEPVSADPLPLITRPQVLETLPDLHAPTPKVVPGESDEGWRKLVADLLPLPPLTGAAPTSSPTPAASVPVAPPQPPAEEVRVSGREGSSRMQIPGTPRAMSTPMPVTTDLTRNRTSSRLVPALKSDGQRQTRKIDIDLAQARERSRLIEAEGLVQAGDRMAGDGAWREAIRQWRAAAEMMPEGSIRRAEVQDQILHAERAQASRRTMIRVGVASVCAVGAVLGAFFGAPPLHNLMASQRYQQVRDGLPPPSEVPPRLAALREFAAAERTPWAWYTTVFGLGYRVEAVERALVQIETERARQEVPPPPPPSKPVSVPQIPLDSSWEEILRLTTAARQAGTLTAAMDAQATLARTEVKQQEDDLQAIARTRAAGDHAAALDQAVAFRARHTRAIPATLGRLPQPLRIRVRVAATPVPPDLKILLDGVSVPVALPNKDADDLPVLELVGTRILGRESSLVVQATGWTFDQATIPADSPADTVGLLIRPIPVWHLPDSRTAWATLHSLGGTLALLRADGLTQLRVADGGEVARYQPTGRTLTPLLRVMPGGRLLVGTDDGMVQVLSPALVAEQVLHRGRFPVSTQSELELSFQVGRKIRLVVEDGPGRRTFAAWEGAREWWSNTDLRPGPLPFVMHVDDRILAIDGATARFYEEDGKLIRDIPLPAPRTGAVQILSGRRELIVPTAAANQRLYLGDRNDPMQLVVDPVINGLGRGALAADADLLVQGGDGGLTLVKPGQPSTVAWRRAGVRRPGPDPVLTPRWAIATDEQGQVTICRRSDGVIIWRLLPAFPTALPPIPVDLGGRPGVILLDRQGSVTAYAVP